MHLPDMDNHLLQDGRGEVQVESGVRIEIFCCGRGLLPEGIHQILSGEGGQAVMCVLFRMCWQYGVSERIFSIIMANHRI